MYPGLHFLLIFVLYVDGFKRNEFNYDIVCSWWHINIKFSFRIGNPARNHFRFYCLYKVTVAYSSGLVVFSR
jgi:hypothetical protein